MAVTSKPRRSPATEAKLTSMSLIAMTAAADAGVDSHCFQFDIDVPVH
jgi:hypothetical protein